METGCRQIDRTLSKTGTAALFALFFMIQMAGLSYGQTAILTWDPNQEPHLAGYNVYRSQQSATFGSTPLNGAVLLTTPEFSDDTVQPGKTYYYVVRAASLDGTESVNSSQVQAVIPLAGTNVGPTVNAGPDRTLAQPVNAIFTAVASDDGLPDGTLTYEWSVVSGSGVTFTDSNSATTMVSISSAGTYTLRITASDGQLSSTDDVTVTVKGQTSGNKPPFVDAGPDQNIAYPAATSLFASAADDGEPNGKLDFIWSVVSGKGVTFGSPASDATTVSFGGPGTYVLRVTASDGQLSASDDITVTLTAGLTLLVSKSGELLKGGVASIRQSFNDPRVQRLELYIDQLRVHSADAHSLTYKWDLRQVSGVRTIEARAYDSNDSLLEYTSVTVIVQ